MGRDKVNIKPWPFQKKERAKLIWIDEPIKEKSKWMIKAYFDGEKTTEEITLDWVYLPLLVKDKTYIDGDLNNAQYDNRVVIKNIQIDKSKVKYDERSWVVWGKSRNCSVKSKCFNFYLNGKLHVVPICEIIRGILAPNRFLLNRIVEMDTLENYFTYDIEDGKLNIHFNSLYSSELLAANKINHLAWILTNDEIITMFSKIGYELRKNGSIKFDFLFRNLNIKAKVIEHEKYVQVVEIVGVLKKRINAAEINIYHPSLEETMESDEVKKRKYVGKDFNGSVQADTTAAGTTNKFDEINTSMEHQYIRLPKINKLKTGQKVKRAKEGSNTKIFIKDSGNLRSVADEGGQGIIKGLEFSSIDKVEVKGELESFINMMKSFREKPEVVNVEVFIGELPGYRTFAKLSDGITRRKYGIGKVTMIDGEEKSFIDVERENRSLSMLVLTAKGKVNWKWIYNRLLYGVINESGVWSNDIIDKVIRMGIKVNRKRHKKYFVEKGKVLNIL